MAYTYSYPTSGAGSNYGLLSRKRTLTGGRGFSEKELGLSRYPELRARANQSSLNYKYGLEEDAAARAEARDVEQMDMAREQVEEAQAQAKKQELTGNIQTGVSVAKGATDLYKGYTAGQTAQTGLTTTSQLGTGAAGAEVAGAETVGSGLTTGAVDTAVAGSEVAPATTTPKSTGGGISWGGLGVAAGIAAQQYLAGKTQPRLGGDTNESQGAITGLFSGKSSQPQTYTSWNQPYWSYASEKEGLAPTSGEQTTRAFHDKDQGTAARYGMRTQYEEWVNPASQLNTLGASRIAGYNYNTDEEGGKAHQKYSTIKLGLDPSTVGIGVLSGDSSERRAIEDYAKGKMEDISDDVGTVICTELNRQGYLSDEFYTLDGEFGTAIKANDMSIYIGYRKLADPIVRLMKKSKSFTWIVSKLALPWAKEMAYVVRPDEHKGNLIGKIIMKIGLPLCKAVGDKEALWVES